ncbi:MAG: DUF2096 family protein [Candidatus Bathyarchaeota archaeon]|nr:DUF2096 family protein [Candidatus Bathyarchaeota archaeon]
MSQSHVAKSKLLEEIIVELRKKGLEIPANVMSDLKSARTLMKIEKTDARARGETEPKIDKYLGMVEAYVITETGNHFPAEQVEKWLTELDLASCDSCVCVAEPEEKMRMIPGVPRNQRWIRVEPIEELPLEKLEQMATEAKLSFRPEKDGRLIVYGADEAVKGFIKKMTKPNGQAAN